MLLSGLKPFMRLVSHGLTKLYNFTYAYIKDSTKYTSSREESFKLMFFRLPHSLQSTVAQFMEPAPCQHISACGNKIFICLKYGKYHFLLVKCLISETDNLKSYGQQEVISLFRRNAIKRALSQANKTLFPSFFISLCYSSLLLDLLLVRTKYFNARF